MRRLVLSLVTAVAVPLAILLADGTAEAQPSHAIAMHGAVDPRAIPSLGFQYRFGESGRVAHPHTPVAEVSPRVREE